MKLSQHEIERLAQHSLRRSQERRAVPRKSNRILRFCVVAALLTASVVIATLALAGTYSGAIVATLVLVAAVVGVGVE